MNNFWKSVLKFLFSKTTLDEKVADTLETVKNEAAELDEKFDNFKEELEKEEGPQAAAPKPKKKSKS
jgi:hypothetical protein